ncbi:hypothetical protein TspCOW1_15770 [Thiohalobacter sp. COW1]|uniref:NADH:ubiquinone oxidoreductase subunit 5 n=1 Tax=Thiohalobacter thiocyanaticus TaxID=585455 RepID=A0A1Z4VQJ8_9GAMM|nr:MULTISPECIES: hypothetical protein [Thiohalobacter]BAZ93484.1 NADH:ubiquinone oxidoreductase subunit 5 [Thiohalobacter thiocyanaticus]BCO31474.1 hypothetical protein TspCOW1_15770 [Thiohalobacter sp. COW1]
MDAAIYLLAGLFLPLFPLSMAFNLLLRRLRRPAARTLILLVWPQIGLALVATAPSPPDWLLYWALLTSALYAFRALTLRELGLWTGFLASSLWALLWLVLARPGEVPPALHGLGLSVPLVLLGLLGAGLEQRFGAAYAGLHGGLAQRLPRLSGVVVVVVLAVIAMPLFPPFFTLLTLTLATAAAAPGIALALVTVWLLWSWAAARLLQGLVVGPGDGNGAEDLSRTATWAYAAVLGLLAGAGLYLLGGLA